MRRNRGLIVYGRDGWDDGGEFVEQVKSLIADAPDIRFTISDETLFGVGHGEIFANLTDGATISESEGMPEWAMCRTSDWKCVYMLEQMGIKCFPTSDYIRAASDKVVSHLATAKVLPQLTTLCRLGTANDAGLPTPLIVKESEGFGGHGVRKANTQDELHAAIGDMDADKKTCVYQALASSPDDLRVYIIGQEILFAILRHAAVGSDKANFCQGGTGEVYELSDDEKKTIEGIFEVFPDNYGFISVDFLFDNDRNIVFNEMNCFPGLAGLVQMGWQERFVEKYMEYIEKKVAKNE